MIAHLFPRLLIAIVGLVILGLQNLHANKGGGNNGMDVKLWLFLALVILLFEGLYLFFETLYFLYKSRYRFATINLVILAVGITIFLILLMRS